MAALKKEKDMPFEARTTMSQKKEFVHLANQRNANIRELCRRHKISPTTGYKYLNRYRDEGEDGLEPRSRKPLTSPCKTSVEMEDLILAIREAHGKWGARKIKHVLEMGNVDGVPAESTVNAILKRNSCIDEAETAKRKGWKRFECPDPNDQFQMDFKGHFEVGTGRCHPLDLLDDCSRFLICLEACGNEKAETVKACLTKTFRHYGLPSTIVVDNGPPWGGFLTGSYTELVVWLFRLGVRVINTAPWHPQTNGKIERMHRSLKSEVLQGRHFKNLSECQKAFDEWRYIYNYHRPHEGIGMKVPADRYEMSRRSFPERIPEIEYIPGDHVRMVNRKGCVSFQNRDISIGTAFAGFPVAFRPTEKDGEFDVFFSSQYLIHVNLFIPPRGYK